MNDITKLNPAEIRKAEWLAERDELLTELSEFEKVESDSELTVAGHLQTKASKCLKSLEKERKRIKQPALDFGEDVDAAAKEMGAELTAAIARIKKLNGDYATKIAKEAEAERQRIAAEMAAREAAKPVQTTMFGGVEITADVIEEETQPIDLSGLDGKVKTGANAMVTVWEFQVVDPKQVPAEFLTVDEKKIRQHMNYKTKMGETPEVKGVVFSSRVDVRAR